MSALLSKVRALLDFGPRETSFTDPQAWEDIYDRHGKGPEFTRHPQTWLPYYRLTPSIFNADGEDHDRSRRDISKALSEPNIRSCEPLVQSYVNSLMSEISERCHPPHRRAVLRMDSWLSFTTYDIMHHLCLGEPSRCLETGRHQSWLDLHFKNPRWALADLACRLVPGLASWWTSGPPAPLKQQARETFQAIHTTFHRTLTETEKPKDDNFLTRLSSAPFKDSNTVAKLESTFLVMHIKASEATATVLSGIMHYLAKGGCRYNRANDPTPFEILRDEIRTTFSSSSDISSDRLCELPYLNAVIEEGLRLCPPFPNTFTRYVPAGGATVCGQDLAANAPISIDRFHMCRSDANFSNAGSFQPGRWLRQTEEMSTKPEGFPIHNQDAFHPFGFGSGGCPGKSLAYMVMRIILAKLIWHFDFFMAEVLLPWEKQTSGVLVERRAWAVGLRLRDEELEKIYSWSGWVKRDEPKI